MTFEQDAAEVGRRADTEIGVLSGENDRLVGTVTTLTADNAALRAEVARLQAIIDAGNPPPPPVVPPALFGASSGYPLGIGSMETAIGARFACRRSYDGGIPASFAAHEAWSDVGVRASVLSVKAARWDASGRAAAVDALVAFGESWPDGHAGCLIVNHEPENDNKPAADFLLLQKAVVEAWHRVRPDVPIGGNLMSYTLDPRSGRNVDDWVYGGWDFLSFDGYDKTGAKSIASIFEPCLAVAQRHGLPFAIGEYGTVRSAKAAWTRDGAALVDEAGGLFACYWPSSRTGYDYPWHADEYPEVRAIALDYGGKAL